MKTASNHRIALLTILMLAFALRLGVAVWWQARVGERFAFGDSLSYWSLAESLSEGEPYVYGSYDAKIFRTPGYPLLLTPLFWLWGGQPPLMAARLLGVICGTLGVWGVWWLARNLFGTRASNVAAVLAAIYPGAVAMSALVLSESVFCPLVILQLAIWVAAWREQRRSRAIILAIWAGVVAGLATLVRPEWLLFTPFALTMGLLLCRDRSRQLRLGEVTMLALLVVMTPWWARNAAVSGRFVPTTLQVGVSMYDGLSPVANGASDMEFVEQFVAEMRRNDFPLNDDRWRKGDLFEYRLDRLAKSRASDWAIDNPGRTMYLSVVKFLRMWNVWPNEPSLSAWPIRIGIALVYIPVMLLGIIAAVKTFRWGWPYVLCWIPAVYLTLLHVIFVSSIRYRQPAMFGLIVLAAGVLAIWGSWDIPLDSVGKREEKR